jgi:hypothetical protein
MMLLRNTLFGVLLMMLIVGCRKEEAVVLPVDSHSVHGLLQPAEISLVRRGSHLLLVDGQQHAYAESTTVNLRSYEWQHVTLSGSYTLNTDPSSLPVFVVGAVLDVEETMKEWAIPSLGLLFQAPVSWNRQSSPGKVHFFLPDKEDPIVTLYAIDRPTVEEDLPKGVSVIIDGTPAIRQTHSATGLQKVVVLRENALLVLEFFPGIVPEEDSLRAQWLNLLSTIRFDSTVVSSRASSGTGAQNGRPCGGSAGILCPSGQYCAIVDVQNDIGVCLEI